MTPYLSIVVPLYNEEESVDKLVARIRQEASRLEYAYEIILVDDGSKDGTWRSIERLQQTTADTIRGIKFRKNFGQTAAMVAGFEHSNGQVIITMDGDLQNDPADIPMLLDKMKEGYDVVSGWRQKRKDHWSRVLPSRIANKMISWMTGVHLHDYGCSLKAYRASCIKPLKAYGEMHRFFPALASMTGARIAEIPVNHHPRRYGSSKYGFSRIFKVFSDIFAINLIIRFSSMPLKGFAVCSIPLVLLAAFFGLLSVLAVMLQWADGKALAFMFAAGMCGVGVVHMLVLGFLGELIVGSSDLSHTRMPEATKKMLDMPAGILDAVVIKDNGKFEVRVK
jgi:glycosyltransferase involved in cell wall biosynthesis